MNGVAPILAFDEVSFGYRRLPILREVTFEVAPKEFLALVGANGAGKTTLLRLALGLLQPTLGTVRLFGTPLASFRDWHRVGYVPQRAATSGVLPISVDEAIRTGLAGSQRWFGRATPTQRGRIEHVVDVMGLQSVRRQRLHTLSGGQQQRALIARALVSSPELLVLDEPTTGVDAGARSVLRDSLKHLVDHEGVGVVYVSHDPEGFAGLADRVVEVLAGRLVPAVTGAGHVHLESEHPTSQTLAP